MLTLPPKPLLLCAHDREGLLHVLLGVDPSWLGLEHTPPESTPQIIEVVQQGVAFQLDPLDVGFTHFEMSVRFKDGRMVDQTMEDVVGNKLDP